MDKIIYKATKRGYEIRIYKDLSCSIVLNDEVVVLFDDLDAVCDMPALLYQALEGIKDEHG